MLAQAPLSQGSLAAPTTSNKRERAANQYGCGKGPLERSPGLSFVSRLLVRSTD